MSQETKSWSPSEKEIIHQVRRTHGIFLLTHPVHPQCFLSLAVIDHDDAAARQRSAAQPVAQVARRLGVLQQHLGDVVQVLLVRQPVAAVHVVTVSQQALDVGGDAAGSAVQPETHTLQVSPRQILAVVRSFFCGRSLTF